MYTYEFINNFDFLWSDISATRTRTRTTNNNTTINNNNNKNYWFIAAMRDWTVYKATGYHDVLYTGCFNPLRHDCFAFFNTVSIRSPHHSTVNNMSCYNVLLNKLYLKQRRQQQWRWSSSWRWWWWGGGGGEQQQQQQQWIFKSCHVDR